MLMCIQNLVRFCQFVLKILSGNEILTSIKGRNSVKILQKMTGNNPKLDLVNVDVHTKFGQILPIRSQDIERKRNANGITESRNHGMTEPRNHGTTEGQGESSIAPLFQSGAINNKAVGLVVSEKKIFFSFSYCRSMETIHPRGVANFDPGDMIGTIYVEDH